jgi:septal ring factor EnvC (AmiA/AmiB activator)
MEFKCLCCNADFTTNSNLRKHERSAKHVKMMEKLNAEPTENIRFRNTISELETENSTLKKRIAQLENEVKNKQDLNENQFFFLYRQNLQHKQI